jgi:hypothetical protein
LFPLAVRKVSAPKTFFNWEMFVGAFAAYGFDGYTLRLPERLFSPKHMFSRPGGAIGSSLGVMRVSCFLNCLHLLRRQWGRLGGRGR